MSDTQVGSACLCSRQHIWYVITVMTTILTINIAVLSVVCVNQRAQRKDPLVVPVCSVLA